MAGAAKKMADIRLDNLAGDLEYLSGDWDAFTMSLMKGNTSNGLRDFVKEADKLLSDFSGVVEEHGLGTRSVLSLIGEGIKDLKDKFLAFDDIFFFKFIAEPLIDLVFCLCTLYHVQPITARSS